MIKVNFILLFLIIILLVILYINNSEHFAGDLTVQNAEAVANISSMVNSGNMKVTNLEVTNNTTGNNLTINKNINLPRVGSSINYASDDPINFHIKYSNEDNMDGLRVSSWAGGDFRTKQGGDKRILWWNNGGVGMTDLYSNNIYLGGNLNFTIKPIIMKTYNNITNGWADIADMWVNSQMNATEYPVYAIGQFYQDGYYTNNDWAGEAPIKAKIENGNWMFKVNNGNKIGNKWNMSITFFHKSIAASQ